MAKDCPQHASQQNATNRAELDRVMDALDENQAGKGRHKCPTALTSEATVKR